MLKDIFRSRFRKKARENREFCSKLISILGYSPADLTYYKKAFIHKSASVTREDGTIMNNERLEYLGDSVLDAIISDHLFRNFPYKNEGFLSKIRSRIVKRTNLNEVALKMGLQNLVQSNTDNCQEIRHVYGDALEALIGAVYLDKGYDNTRKIVEERILNHYIDIEELLRKETDFKSRVIEWAQKNKKDIIFESQEEYIEDQNNPLFVSKIKINDLCLGSGKGFSKKEAEQKAAEEAFHAYCQESANKC
ncbi:MAG: ribonuclease III [Bacteroidota bacterium]